MDQYIAKSVKALENPDTHSMTEAVVVILVCQNCGMRLKGKRRDVVTNSLRVIYNKETKELDNFEFLLKAIRESRISRYIFIFIFIPTNSFLYKAINRSTAHERKILRNSCLFGHSIPDYVEKYQYFLHMVSLNTLMAFLFCHFCFFLFLPLV